MLNVFQLATLDQSIQYLGQIFGNVGVALTGTGPALLSVMFKTFNTGLLVIGALIVAYTTVVGVLATASEGKFLGEKWDSLWVPLRTLLGLVALFPTKSGYCAAQVVIMWVVVQGIGAADQVWNTVIRYYNVGGTATATTLDDNSSVVSMVPPILRNLLENATCQAATAKFVSNNQGTIGRSTAFTSSTGEQIGFQFGVPGSSVSESECGFISWVGDPSKTPPATFTEAMKAGTRQTVQALTPVYESIANYYVNLAINDPKCWDPTPCSPEPNPTGTPPVCVYFKKYLAFKWSDQCSLSKNSGAWEKIAGYVGSNFINESYKLIQGYAGNYQTQAQMNQPTKEDPAQRAMTQGWIFAGAYYYNFAKTNRYNSANFTDFIQSIYASDITKDPKLSQGPAGAGSRFAAGTVQLDNYNHIAGFGFKDPNNQLVNPNAFPVQYFVCGEYDNKNALLPCQDDAGGARSMFNSVKGNLDTAVVNAGGFNAPEGGGPTGEAINSASRNIFNTWMANLSAKSTDPLISLGRFGNQLLVGAETFFWVSFGLMIGLGLAGTYITYFGSTANYWAGVAAAIQQFVSTPIWFLIGYMMTIGGLLGVYTPLIPYINFTFGAIGWFLAVIEAMVAGPIIALGILSPGGQSQILGRAEGATFILLNIFLRPTLMVFGMMFAMLLSFVVISFINAAFLGVVGSVSGGTMGLFEILMFIMAYAMMVITALNKCFSLIGLLPDQVLRWIGQAPERFGAGEEAGEAVKGGVAGGAAAGKAGMEGSMGAPKAAAGLKKTLKRLGKEKEQRGGIGAS